MNEAGYGIAIASVYVTPTITQHPQDIMTDYNVDRSFTCTAEAFPAPTYSWERSGGEGEAFMTIDDEDTNELSFKPVDHSNAGEYRCVATMTDPDTNTQYPEESDIATLHGKSCPYM